VGRCTRKAARWSSMDIRMKNRLRIVSCDRVPRTIARSFGPAAAMLAFMETIRPEGFRLLHAPRYDKIYREGRKVLMKQYRHRSALIADSKRPVRLHSRHLLADIVPRRSFNCFSGDQTPFQNGHRSGGRRVHVVAGGGHRLPYAAAYLILTARNRGRRRRNGGRSN